MADPTDAPSVNDPTGTPEVDKFGPPHAHTVAESLHLWILIPGLIIVVLIGFLFYRLIHKQGERERKREEKKRLKQEKKEKKKAK